jgi:hypothetical protein
MSLLGNMHLFLRMALSWKCRLQNVNILYLSETYITYLAFFQVYWKLYLHRSTFLKLQCCFISSK